MKKINSKAVIKIFAVLICLVSIGGGIFSTVSATKASKDYDAQMEIVEDYDKKFNEKDGKFKDNPFLSAPVKQQQSEEKKNDALIQAETDKKHKQKFTFLSIALYVVAVMMLVCTIALSKKSPKKKKSSDK